MNEDLVTNYPMRTGNNWGTGVVISTDDGKILLGLRKDTKDWTTPGGKVDVGETALLGAIRETKEECGIDMRMIRTPDFMGVNVEQYGSKVWVNFLFCLRGMPLDMKEDVEPQATEFVTWEWVDIDQALTMKLFPPCVAGILRFKQLREELSNDKISCI